MAALGDFAAINYVTGAPDGHSKNVSLLLLPNEIKVAPLYDLATGLPYDGDPGLRRSTRRVVRGQAAFRGRR
ncbi:hypothetical protein BCD48_33835 [Pseudofrankia sp. BMG5.36]|nr:HipA domain-containing protein [Pseudofrankia sp. BMG5.36]OHV73011.1 hypothetical protein BCD48_33835 [Pseudofrankia sp. BMG5.36]